MKPEQSAGDSVRGNAPRYLLLGEILRPHGIAGELRMRVLTAYPERLSQLHTVFIGRDPESEATAYTILNVRMHQGYALLTLAGIQDRTTAEGLRDQFVMIDLANAVPLEPGEVYLYQLIGMTVQEDDGQILGVITEVLETGANDVYIVDSPRYGEILIPITPDTLIQTDVQAGLVTVRLPDGLLPQR